MTFTTFLVMYLIGGGFSWIAWTIFFIMARGSGFSQNKISFFTDFIGGSTAMILGWPFGILYFIFQALFSKKSVL